MSFQLLSVLSAAALAASGTGASETRSAQSLPVQNLVVAHASGGVSSKLRTGNHLTDDASDSSDEGRCKRRAGYWDDKKKRCRRGGWLFDPGASLLIGAGTIAGIVYALTEGGTEHGVDTGSNGHPVSF